MKPHAALYQRTAASPRGGKSSTRPGGFRLLAALLLLGVPLAVAAWGLGGYSAQRERNNADTRLIDSLNSAGGAYRGVFVERRLGRQAGSPNEPRVQHELLHGAARGRLEDAA